MKPVVGIVADRKTDDGVELDLMRTRYVEALTHAAEVVPMIMPTDLSHAQVGAVMAKLDGLVLGGAESNVQPSRYSGKEGSNSLILDVARDKTAFAAIEVARRNKMPILGICRGLQELNVAFGGTLDQDFSSTEGRLRHFEDKSLPRDSQYLPVHDVRVVENGHVADCLKRLGTTKIMVNSLHRQAISRLGQGLSVDLVAEDGVVEAISVSEGGTYIAGVQWHPEWYYRQDPLSREIFARFGRACRLFASGSTAGSEHSDLMACSSGYNLRLPKQPDNQARKAPVKSLQETGGHSNSAPFLSLEGR